MLCPCTSGKNYEDCCAKYHKGALAENALVLMKSRYAAYSLNLASYIIKTTHPQNPAYEKDLKKWQKEIEAFSKNTVFKGLDIIEFIDGEKIASVTFKAHLAQNSLDVSFVEKSLFEKLDGRWLYKKGLILR